MFKVRRQEESLENPAPGNAAIPGGTPDASKDAGVPGTVAVSIGVITVNWNDARHTLALLASLAQLEHRQGTRLHVVVVDNGSQDGSGDVVAASDYDVTVLRLAENEGYGGAVNAGLRELEGRGVDYFWVLNNDTTVAPDALARLLAAAGEVGDATILSPTIYFQAQRDRVWFGGGWLDWRLKSYHRFEGEIDQGQIPKLAQVEWISGCAPFFSRAVLERCGLWATDYFLYLEDVDWSLMARSVGIACYVVGDAHIWHDVSSSVNTQASSFVRYYAWRNYYYLGRRWGRGWLRLWVEADLWWTVAKGGLRWLFFPAYRNDAFYHARTRGLLDLIRGRMGQGWPAVAMSPASPTVTNSQQE